VPTLCVGMHQRWAAHSTALRPMNYNVPTNCRRVHFCQLAFYPKFVAGVIDHTIAGTLHT
ncbi:hypothetical protein TI05_17815, partial [Achromatium sp. WMS3]